MYFYSCYYLPLERGYPVPLNKLKSPSPKDDFCQVWLQLISGSGEEVENVKVTDGQTDGRTDRRRTTGDQKTHLSFQLR
jgi:hypothetical protein